MAKPVSPYDLFAKGKEEARVIVLTEYQVRLLAKGLYAVASAIETGKPIEVGRRLVKIAPAVALRNQAGWLYRTLREQYGGARVVTPWDFPEER